MILDRVYEPHEDELIYHYCSPSAFLGIMNSRSMWLSAYYVLNDLVERHWGLSVLERAFAQLEKEVEKTFLDRIREMIATAYFNSIMMISSYSLDPDVLSQWRAYAEDGRGFAIGFSPKQMQMSAKKLRVCYDEDRQLYELIGNLRHTYEYEKSIGFKYDEQFRSHWFNIGLDLCAYKHPTFREEKEIRLAHVSGLEREGDSLKLVALGARGVNGETVVGPSEIHFRVGGGGVIIPYVVLDFTNNGTTSPVKEVLLGPQNESHESNISIFLNTVGMPGVTVRRSQAPYYRR